MSELKELFSMFTSSEALNMIGFMLYGLLVLELCKVLIFPLIDEITNLIIRIIKKIKVNKNDYNKETNQ